MERAGKNIKNRELEYPEFAGELSNPPTDRAFFDAGTAKRFAGGREIYL